jgi:NhaP-type Na+/H+ or K+/H+ antiporter
VVVALLLVIRPLSVVVALAGSRIERRHRAFLAWFGVRGLGSLYYVAAALSYGVLPREHELTVFWTATVAVVLSVLAHGATGSAGARLLGARRR